MWRILIISLVLISGFAVAQPAAPDKAPQPDDARPSSTRIPGLPPDIVPPHLSGPTPLCRPPTHVDQHVMGPTIVSFKIAKDGTVTDVVVQQSSGAVAVDEAAKSCIAGWLYTPAMKNGQPVEFSTTGHFEWKAALRSELPPSDPSKITRVISYPVRKDHHGSCEGWHAAHGVSLAFYVEPDGSVKDVTVLQSSGDAAIDKDAIDCVSGRAYRPAMRDGQPIEVRLTARLYASTRFYSVTEDVPQ